MFFQFQTPPRTIQWHYRNSYSGTMTTKPPQEYSIPDERV